MPALGQQILGNTNPYMGPALIEYIGLARTDTAYSFEIFCNQTPHEHCAHFNRLHKERCVHKVQYHSISPSSWGSSWQSAPTEWKRLECMQRRTKYRNLLLLRTWSKTYWRVALLLMLILTKLFLSQAIWTNFSANRRKLASYSPCSIRKICSLLLSAVLQFHLSAHV